MNDVLLIVITAVITAAVTGVISTVATVIALKIHIQYLREAVKRVDLSTEKAHIRISLIERNCPQIHRGVFTNEEKTHR